MYIRGLIPWNFAELAEAVPNKLYCIKSVQLIQCSSFIMECLSHIGMDGVISELCYKWTILQRKCR